MSNYNELKKMKRICLIKNAIVVILLLVPTFSFTQVNILIDSLVLNARTTEKSIIVENKIGERTEYLYNTSNKLARINRSYISNSLESGSDQSLRYYVDSLFYRNDSVYSKFYTYILTESEGEYVKTLEKQDSSIFAIRNYQIERYSDSTIWYTGKKEILDKHILRKINGKFAKYSYQLNLSGRDLGGTWMVKYKERKAFLIDTTHSRLCIYYDIIILKYSKLGIPQKIYSYDWLLASFNEPDIMGYIMSRRQTRKPLRVFEITYCSTDDCLEENSLESKKVKTYLKFTQKHPDYHYCF